MDRQKGRPMNAIISGCFLNIFEHNRTILTRKHFHESITKPTNGGTCPLIEMRGRLQKVGNKKKSNKLEMILDEDL